MDRLDLYERKPAGMEKYLSIYGWHFSKAMCNWAVSMMRDRNGARIKPTEKQSLEEMLKANNIQVQAKGYDAVYVAAMVKSDYYGSSITTDMQYLKFIADYMDDKDGYDGIAFTRFYADCLAKGIPILWEDML